jgi:hypothetical protein
MLRSDVRADFSFPLTGHAIDDYRSRDRSEFTSPPMTRVYVRSLTKTPMTRLHHRIFSWISMQHNELLHEIE